MTRALRRQREAFAIFRSLADAPEGIRRAEVRADDGQGNVVRARNHLLRALQARPVPDRPECGSDAELDELGRMLSTFLRTSFEISERYHAAGECGCGVCDFGWFPRAVPRRVRASDRRHARELLFDVVRCCASDRSVELTNEDTEALLDDPVARRASALVAYGELLIERLRGETRGAEALVLWREFAWVRGAPLREFELAARAILDAEQTLSETWRR